MVKKVIVMIGIFYLLPTGSFAFVDYERFEGKKSATIESLGDNYEITIHANRLLDVNSSELAKFLALKFCPTFSSVLPQDADLILRVKNLEIEEQFSFGRKYFTKYSMKKQLIGCDNFRLVNRKGLEGSFEIFKDIIDAFELGIYPKTIHLCEPNLSNYDLYPTMGKVNNRYNKNIKNLINLLAYCDGKSRIFQIANKINYPLKSLLEDLRNLSKKKILRLS